MAKKHKDKEEKKTRFEEFAEQYGNAKQFQYGLEDVGEGKGNDAIPDLVQDVISENSALSDQERARLWDGTKTDLGNYYVISPFLKEGYRKEHKKFAEFGKDNLEGILDSTPEEFQEKILMEYAAPDKKHPVTKSSYEELGELHHRVFSMNKIFEELNNPKLGENRKEELVNHIKSDIVKYYKKQYKVESGDDEKTAEDKKAALRFFIAIIEYKKDENGRFALGAYKDIFDEKKKEFHEKVKGNFGDYLKSFLKEEEILGVYNHAFDEVYKRKEK